jgi:hypothetical protein
MPAYNLLRHESWQAACEIIGFIMKFPEAFTSKLYEEAYVWI